MGERNSPDAGETTLAAATAAIITARWQPASAPAGAPGPNGSSNGHGPAGVSSGAPSPWAPPASDTGLPPVSPAPFAPVSPAAASPFSAPPARPVSPGAGYGSPHGGAGSFFSAADPVPVPEVFDAPVPSPRDGGRHGSDLPQDLSEPLESVRTQIPPGFERRNFGPVPDEPPPPTSGAGWRSADPRGEAHDRPPEPPPSALLGTIPPTAWSEPAATPTLAPPEPAPWVDPGWTDFGDLSSRPSDYGGESGTSTSDGGGESASRAYSSGDGGWGAPEGGEPPSRTSYDREPERTETLVGAGVATGAAQPLPRRVPRPPDVDFPLFASDPTEPAPDPATERHELNRIADYLRDEAEAPGPTERPDGVDLESVLAAVRKVPEVRDAQLRWNAQAGHTLRIEFVDGVDEAEVTRSVVRLLRSKLGLAAQPSAEEPTVDTPYRGRVSVGTARVPGRQVAPVVGGRPLSRPSGVDIPRLVLDNVTVTRLGAEATVEVRLRGPAGTVAVGEGRGPGVDAYLSRLAATAAGHAVDQALANGNRGKVFIEHVSVVPFGVTEVAVVVLLLAYGEVTEQLSGSAIVGDDPHQAVVRATLAALNRRLEALL